MTLYDRDIFEHEGRRFMFWTEQDDTMDPPWKAHDGHGPVREGIHHAGQGTKPTLRAGERLLSWHSHGHFYAYDFAEACRIARTDWIGEAWNRPADRKAILARYPGATTLRQVAEKLAEADFERLRRWCNDDWTWCGVIVAPVNDDDEPDETHSQSLWGIESDAGDYFEGVAGELAGEISSHLAERDARAMG